MKKVLRYKIVFFLFFIGGLSYAYGEDIDLVVMIDTSESMFPYYNDVVNYMLQDILKKELHYGDMFHLLSFSTKPETEITTKITNSKGIEKILKRLIILQPLGKFTDLIQALNYLYQYVKELPTERKKVIILITDGINDPPPGSPYYGLSEREVLTKLKNISSEIKKEGWVFHIVQMPLKEKRLAKPEKSLPKTTHQKIPKTKTSTTKGSKQAENRESKGVKPGRSVSTKEKPQKSLLPNLSTYLSSPIIKYTEKNKKNLSAAVTGFPRVIWPTRLGKVHRTFDIPFSIENYSSEIILLRLDKILLGNRNILTKPIVKSIKSGTTGKIKARVKLPNSFLEGKHSISLKLVFKNSERILPDAGKIEIIYKKGFSLSSISLNTSYLIYILLIIGGISIILLLIKLFLFLKNRVIESNFETIMHTSSTTQKSPLIEMRVSFQNPHIGFRNIHTIPPGKSRTVGGGNSDYLIFLVHFPPRIAIIQNEDNTYIFKPLKPELFPDTQEQIQDCLHKEICVISPKGFKLTLYFREYISPLEEINRLMHSVIKENEEKNLLPLKKKK